MSEDENEELFQASMDRQEEFEKAEDKLDTDGVCDNRDCIYPIHHMRGYLCVTDGDDNSCTDAACKYQEPHPHGFACDSTCICKTDRVPSFKKLYGDVVGEVRIPYENGWLTITARMSADDGPSFKQMREEAEVGNLGVLQNPAIKQKLLAAFGSREILVPTAVPVLDAPGGEIIGEAQVKIVDGKEVIASIVLLPKPSGYGMEGGSLKKLSLKHFLAETAYKNPTIIEPLDFPMPRDMFTKSFGPAAREIEGLKKFFKGVGMAYGWLSDQFVREVEAVDRITLRQAGLVPGHEHMKLVLFGQKVYEMLNIELGVEKYGRGFHMMPVRVQEVLLALIEDVPFADKGKPIGEVETVINDEKGFRFTKKSIPDEDVPDLRSETEQLMFVYRTAQERGMTREKSDIVDMKYLHRVPEVKGVYDKLDYVQALRDVASFWHPFQGQRAAQLDWVLMKEKVERQARVRYGQRIAREEIVESMRKVDAVYGTAPQGHMELDGPEDSRKFYRDMPTIDPMSKDELAAVADVFKAAGRSFHDEMMTSLVDRDQGVEERIQTQVDAVGRAQKNLLAGSYGEALDAVRSQDGTRIFSSGPIRKKVVKDLYTAADFGDIQLLDPEEAEWLRQDSLAEDLEEEGWVKQDFLSEAALSLLVSPEFLQTQDEAMAEYIKLATRGHPVTRIFDPLENRTAIFLHKSDQSPESGLLLWSSDQQEAQDG